MVGVGLNQDVVPVAAYIRIYFGVGAYSIISCYSCIAQLHTRFKTVRVTVSFMPPDPNFFLVFGGALEKTS